MNIGIDIGSTKTVIFSTLESGTNVNDEFGRREIPTVIEKTSPIRSFGKSVCSDSLENIKLRSRFFLTKLLDKGSRMDLLMFLNYLHRTIQLSCNYRSAALTIPEFFGEEERQILRELVGISDLRVCTFMTHITSVAACAALRSPQIDPNFMIIDSGFSKTVVGVFSFVDNKLTPQKRWCIRRGASDFDEAVYSILIKNYALPDTDITREKLLKEVGTIKRGLNSLDCVKTRIFDENYQIVNMEIHRTDYLSTVQPILDELRSFFKTVKEESGFEGYIEVVGNNSNNAYIQDILRGLSYNTTLNTSESAALGACLGLGVNSRKLNYKVEEIMGYDISVKIEGENVRPTKVFSSTSVVTSDPMRIKYHRKGSFNLEVLENDVKIGTIRITKKESESPENVTICVRIGPFMTLEVQSVECESDCSFTYDTFGLSEEEKNEIKSTEDSFRKTEVEKKLMGEMRNYVENFLDSFDRSIEKVFPGLLDGGDIASIDKVRDNFFDSPISASSLEEEEAIKVKVLKDLDFVSEKIARKAEAIKKEAEECIRHAETFEFKYNTPAVKSVKALIHRLKLFCDSFKLDLESVVRYDSFVFSDLKNEMSFAIAQAGIEQDEELKKEVSHEENPKDNAGENNNQDEATHSSNDEEDIVEESGNSQ